MDNIIVIEHANETYVLMAPRGVRVAPLLEEFFKDKFYVQENVYQFLKWLVSIHGFARLDEGMDFDVVKVPSYSTD